MGSSSRARAFQFSLRRFGGLGRDQPRGAPRRPSGSNTDPCHLPGMLKAPHPSHPAHPAKGRRVNRTSLPKKPRKSRARVPGKQITWVLWGDGPPIEEPSREAGRGCPPGGREGGRRKLHWLGHCTGRNQKWHLGGAFRGRHSRTAPLVGVIPGQKCPSRK